jgi:hypothetical protein
MIIAETKLKRIPDNCAKCKLSYLEGQYSYNRICSITNKVLEMQKVESGNKAYVRPSWCPLKEV